jgi:hypothetical protein
MLMLLEEQKLQSSHPLGCSVITAINQQGACNQRKNIARILILAVRS